MKKLIAIVLSLAMLVSCIPMTVFAGEEGGGEGGQSEKPEVKIVYELVTRIIKTQAFQDSFTKANAFLDKYQADIENLQILAQDFVDHPEKYTDYLDNMIGDLDDLIVLLAKDADEDLKDLIEELKKIRTDLEALKEQILLMIDEVSGDLSEIQEKIAGLLKTQYDIIKGYVDTVEKWLAEEIGDIIQDLKIAAWQIKEFTEKELGEIIGRVKELEAIIDSKIADLSTDLQELISKANYWAKMAVEKAVQQIRADLVILKNQIQKAGEFTEEQLKALVVKLRELDELIATEIAQTDEKVQAFIDDVEEWIADVLEPALVDLINDLKAKANELTELTEAEIQGLIGYIIEKSDMLDAFIASKIAEMDAHMEELIGEAKYWLAEVAAPALEQFIEDLKVKAKEIKDYTEAEIEELIKYLVEKVELLEFIVENKIAETSERIQNLIAEAKDWIEYVAEPALEEMIAELKQKAQDIKDYTEAEIKEIIEKAELLQEFIACKIAEESEHLKELIAEAEEWLEEYAAPALKQIIAELKEKAQAIKEFTEAEIKEILEKAELLKEIIASKIVEECEDLKDLIVVASKWAEKAVTKALNQIITVTKEIIKKAAHIAKEDIIKYFEMLRELKEIVKEYIDIIIEFDPAGTIKELIEKAEEIFEESIEWMREKALEYTMELIDNLQSGKYDWLLKPLGITGAELVDLLVDATAYAFGVMSGEGYLDLQDELTAALAQLDAALAALEDAEAELDPKNPNGKVHAMVQEISNLTNQLQQITTENTQLKNQIEELVKKDETEAEVIKKFINGYNVTKKKPTLKKVKALKGRKVKVTFKSLSKVNATQYRFNYKTGKKSKTKKWKKKTSGSKTLNYTLKKLKKGKTYKIKVRGTYSFKYEGKTYTFLSKWSKTKKVKVK